MITTIAFDADDTLWHNERIFLAAKEKYSRLLAGYHDREWVEQRLDEAESRNILHFGYGIKGFTLSMIETACELTEGRVSGTEIREIIGLAREMLAAPIEVLDGVHETIEVLAPDFSLMVVTKGDLFDQEAKLARSGLGDYFDRVEIVSKKINTTYQDILDRNDIRSDEFVMVGNSLRSDILPVLEIGARAVYVPYETEWFHEKVSEDELREKDFATLASVAELPGWIAQVSPR
jgi:putative hydrolase of the HAD superfamily